MYILKCGEMLTILGNGDEGGDKGGREGATASLSWIFSWISRSFVMSLLKDDISLNLVEKVMRSSNEQTK